MSQPIIQSVQIIGATTSYYDPVTLAMGIGLLSIFVVFILSMEKPFDALVDRVAGFFNKRK
jgi:hypothetical protein